MVVFLDWKTEAVHPRELQSTISALTELSSPQLRAGIIQLTSRCCHSFCKLCTIVINCEDSCNRLLLGFANTTRDSSAATTYKLWCKLNGESEVGDSGAVVLNCELEELLGWYCLGICNEEVSLARYLNEPGALEEERWETLHWEEPEKETIPCWWIVNKDDPDKT